MRLAYKTFFLLLLAILSSCVQPRKEELNQELMASLGGEHRSGFEALADVYYKAFEADSGNLEALLGLAETRITLHIFGFTSREESLPEARVAYQHALELDSTDSGVLTLAGMLSFLDWRWEDAKSDFQEAIEVDPRNLKARHWYSLWLSAMGHFEEAMAQSDVIASMDPGGQYNIGRGSLLYFARRNEELKELMIEEIAKDTSLAWGYDWLGMAYIELEDYQNSIDTYFEAFRLSDGTVEVGGGLGHALGMAGSLDRGKQLADFYEQEALTHYLPPVQRAFIHIGIGEYDEAMRLLEEAYEENSWFLAFIQIEPWYDPIRDMPGFRQLVKRMDFPE